MAKPPKIDGRQVGAQGNGIAVQGNENKINTGTQYSVSGSGTTTINNGLGGSDLASVFGELVKSNSGPAQTVSPAATPTANTPATAADSKKKLLKYGLVIAAAILGLVLVKKLFKK